MIYLTSAAQGAALGEIENINGHPVAIDALKTKIVKGTVCSYTMAQNSEEEIIEQLKY